MTYFETPYITHCPLNAPDLSGITVYSGPAQRSKLFKNA